MWIWWTTGPTRQSSGQGYFNCPSCGCRTPCELVHVGGGSTYLFGFIPISSSAAAANDAEIYRCLRCEGEYAHDASIAYGFSEEFETPSWKCFKCQCEIPYEEFECPRCGYRLDVGR
jgi:hypothetical protein